MTITYTYNVATSSFLGFVKLLAKWRGSVYKLVLREFLAYSFAYIAISLVYRNVLGEEDRRIFEKIVLYCHKTVDLIPLSFVLGFYVTFVATRWWSQFCTIPWPDRLMHVVAIYVTGTDTRGRLLRRTLMRYINLCIVLLYQSISGAVKKRFPTSKHLVEAGFMTANERKIYDNVPTKVNKHWIPLIWFLSLIQASVKEGRLQQGAQVKHIVEEVNNLRSKTSLLWGFDWVTVPLLYTQVVTLTTHLFFLTCLLGRQFLDPEQGYSGHTVDIYFPLYTFFQFFFFMGWLKVAEQLINPFGEDDDDFETNWMIDRNIQVSYLGVDEILTKIPKLERDIHWNSQQPEVPYTEAARHHKISNYRGSTMFMIVPPSEQGVASDIPSTNSFRSTMHSMLDRIPLRCLSQRKKPIFKPGTKFIDVSGKEQVYMEEGEKKHTKMLGSKKTLFEDNYLRILNRGNVRDDSLKDTEEACESETSLLPSNRHGRPSIFSQKITEGNTDIKEEGEKEENDWEIKIKEKLELIDAE